jgi:hypothetical protein
MPKFRVYVTKTYTANGVIEVEDDPLCENVNMAIQLGTLESDDPRITWDEPEYNGLSFQTTGDVDCM